MKTYIIELDSEIDNIDMFKSIFENKLFINMLKIWRIRVVESE